MRGVRRSEPEFLAMFPSMNSRCLSVGTRFPGDVSQFKCEAFSDRTEILGDIFQFAREAFSGQNRKSWQYFPVEMRGVRRSELKFLAAFSGLNARRFSARTEIPGGISLFKCEVFANLVARCLSGRTKIPGGIYQFGCEVSVGQNQNSWRYSPV